MKRHAPAAGTTQVVPTVSVNQDDCPITVTYTGKEWTAIVNALELAQKTLIDTVNNTDRPLGPGILAFVEQTTSQICDLREDLQRRRGAR